MASEQRPWRFKHNEQFTNAEVANPQIAWPSVSPNDAKPASSVLEAFRWIGRDTRLTRLLETRLIEIASGLSYDAIAARHQISTNTVKTEARAVYRAIGVRCRHEVESAFDAAIWRSESGATAREVYTFLRLRFE